MKILFLTNIPSPYRVAFFNELGKYCALTVAFQAHSFAHRNSSWKHFVAESFQPVFLAPTFRYKTRILCWGILKLLKQPWDAIVVGGYASWTNMLAIEYMRLKKIPFYLEVDGGLILPDNKLKFWLKKHFISVAAGWFSSGKETTKYLVHYGAISEKIYEYPFSSLMEKDILPQIPTVEQKQTLRNELGIQEEKALISVGQFIHRKGYDILLHAAVKLPKDIGIYIIGDTPQAEYLFLQKELNLTQVHFVGFQSKQDLQKWYQAADVLVLPTREDIWGLVINEAMAQGLPVITTNKCVAGLELVKEGENGYIVPVEDVQRLVQTVMQIFAQDYRAMGQKSLEHISPYTIENMARCHLEFFYGKN